jgi:hypothetical protein
MAGFDYAQGRSNNMVAAEDRGMVTIGRWAKRHGVSARAAIEVMRPTEAHHTGTGRRGKSRLTAVIAGDCEPTAEQVAAMQAWDRGERPSVRGWYTTWEADYSGRFGRRCNIPLLAVYQGDAGKAPRGFQPITDDADWAAAQALAGRQLKPYAKSWREVR